MNISIVIPNYNGEHLLKRNLPKIFSAVSGYSKGTVEVIIVDDASTDDSWGVLSTFADNYKSVHIVKNEKNFGFSTTVNRGVARASGEIVVLLNTDVIPEENFLEKIPSHFTNKKVFAVGFMDKSIEGSETILRGRGTGEFKKGFLFHQRGEVDKTSTLWASGGSSAFRKNIWNDLGGLQELYNPFYWEDIDLSYRALKSGYQIVFDPEIVTTHEHEKGAIKTFHSNQTITVTAYRNQWYFVWLTITDSQYVIQHILWIPFHLARAFITFDKVFLNGFFQAIKHTTSVLNQRKRNMKSFILSDKAILRQFHS